MSNFSIVLKLFWCSCFCIYCHHIQFIVVLHSKISKNYFKNTRGAIKDLSVKIFTDNIVISMVIFWTHFYVLTYVCLCKVCENRWEEYTIFQGNQALLFWAILTYDVWSRYYLELNNKEAQLKLFLMWINFGSFKSFLS